jgi:hypothetical protein
MLYIPTKIKKIMIAFLLSRKDKWIDSLQCDVQYGKYLVREFKDEWNINNGDNDFDDFDDVDIDLDLDKDKMMLII